MSYEYGFEYNIPEGLEGAAEGAVGLATGILLFFWFLAMSFSLITYVLNAVGMYRIAKRRGIHHAWLAWVPVGSSWLLGSISDHYQYVVNSKTTSKRKILLILTIVLAVTCIMMIGGVAVLALSAESAAESVGMALGIMLVMISYLGMMGLSIAVTVFCYIAYYDLFRSSKPDNAVLFLVLSIIFNVTLPFFVFVCGNSDAGMPEKRPRDPAPMIPQWPEEEPAAVEEEIPAVEAEIVEDPE